ncbi:trypsin-like peptidase domain-containing protein [Pseudonocardia parietis]|uniref:Trypsin-like peptidase n=1 Tax=Pseudonocardia parietis TaxID=570936 RepID=A0ABS4VS02_9PSEU|nr:trypsin-like peptidase domain-containing protein [Pseudonocardia parietis]MBP2366705.1 hypothetical protein [Pseudonocardia parietis]
MAALVLLVTPGTVGAAQPPPPPGGAEQLSARIEPAIVQLEIVWSGFVLYPTVDGDAQWSGNLEVVGSCTAFFVSPTGHMTTAGHCVDPAVGRAALIERLLDQQVEQGLLTRTEASGLSADAQVNWTVEGQNAGSPIVRTVQAVQPESVPGATLADPTPAQLLEFQPAEDGDLALLKVEADNAVALPIASADPATGAALTAIGFPATVQAVADINRTRASFISGTVASNQVSPAGVAMTEINATINPGMSGGPTVDGLGNVLGVNSFFVPDSGQASNFVTDTSSLRDWLAARGMTMLPPNAAPAPAATSLFGAAPGTLIWGLAGGGLLLLVVGATVVVLVRRRHSAGDPPLSPGVVPEQRGPGATWAAAPAARPEPSPAPEPQTTPAPRPAPDPPLPAEPWTGTGRPAPAQDTATGPGPGDAAEPSVATLRSQAPRWCEYCGATVGPQARFCGSCGTAAR